MVRASYKKVFRGLGLAMVVIGFGTNFVLAILSDSGIWVGGENTHLTIITAMAGVIVIGALFWLATRSPPIQ